MIKLERKGIILAKRNLEFESGGVFNPACVMKDGVLHMFYRAATRAIFSTIGYCQIKDGEVVCRMDEPLLVPEYAFEKQGMEDPRITYLEGIYYMLYTAYDGRNAVVAYATSTDLKSFDKKGLVTPLISYDEAEDVFRDSRLDKRYEAYEREYKQEKGEGILLWEKDAALFPKKINGRYAIIHRILPGIQILYFDGFEQLTMEFWKKYLTGLEKMIILDPKYWFEESYIGGGCVPIETEEGWLLIYHAVRVEKKEKIYRAGAALLDRNNPQKVIGRLREPLFEPEEEWEKKGVVNNVVFPTGAIVKGEDLEIYYGGGDQSIGLIRLKIKELLSELKESK